MYRELLGRMIDDRLEETAADRAHLSVSSKELDNAIKNVATFQPPEALRPVCLGQASGLTEQDYRDELRRQILEGKLVQLQVQGRVRVTDQDALAAYAAWLKNNGPQALSEVRILAMRVTNASDLKAWLVLANNLVAQARAGANFCQMVSQYSNYTATLATCGSLSPLPVEGLPPEVQGAIRGLKPNEFCNPVVVRRRGKVHWVIDAKRPEVSASAPLDTDEAIRAAAKLAIDAGEVDRARALLEHRSV
jgi:peptidyl-prolyl cis-trans isomerase SurA